MSWTDFETQFGWNPHRRRLLRGMKRALDALKLAGCQTVYIDGSFVTTKDTPGDFDACWDANGVVAALLARPLMTFDPGRSIQKATYFGELFPAHFDADGAGTSYLDFFQIDRLTGNRKGIVALDLRRLP